MNFRARTTRRNEPELDMTPLIDVVFLLLVFFLVTATFAQQQAQSAVPVELPDGTTGEAAAANERITVYLDDAGVVSIETADSPAREARDIADVRRLLDELHAAHPGMPVYLRGDREVPYGRVMEVLDTARAVGFREVYNVVYATGGE